ncbi:TPR domain protein [Aphelenchoides avenae]|nr:TPR domain protein [Aphelenchus avenae]
MFLLRRVASWFQPAPDRPLSLGEIEELNENCHFSLVYKKAKAALEAGEDKERCLMVLSSAAYEMGKWEEAVDHYTELCKAFPSNEDAQDGLRVANARLNEARSGKYDFESLHMAAMTGETDVDVADYVGPMEVVDIPGKGKGVVATQDVKKGTLLLVSKAFAIVDRGAPRLELPKTLEKKLRLHRDKADEVAALHFGGERSADTMSLKSLMMGPRLVAICKYNTFGTVTGEDGPETFNPRLMCGLWILASYFNHSCLQNVHRRFYGDVMVVHAIMDIKKGEEMTLAYIAPIHTYKDRAEQLKEGYDVVCDCRLCELDRADPRCGEREQLLEDMLKPLTTQTPKDPMAAINTITECLNKIRELYADRQELTTLLYSPLKSLANLYQGRGEHAKAVKYLHDSIEHIPESAMSVYGVVVYMQLAECYDRMRKPKVARKYARMAADLHRIRSGHDDELFRQIYPRLARLI